MIELQLLMRNLKAQLERAKEEISKHDGHDNYHEGKAWGKFLALSNVIQKLTFIINAEAETNGEKD